MAKQIIVLDVSRLNGSDINVHWLFWLYPAAGREVPLATGTSQWRNATVPELDAIKAGTVVEEGYNSQWPAGATKAKIQADLVAAYTARAAAFAALMNPNQYYGVSYDSGTGWSA